MDKARCSEQFISPRLCVKEARRVVAEVGRVLTSGKVTAKSFNDDTSKTVGLGASPANSSASGVITHFGRIRWTQ